MLTTENTLRKIRAILSVFFAVFFFSAMPIFDVSADEEVKHHAGIVEMESAEMDDIVPEYLDNGEPNCALCHNEEDEERRPAIDYTNEAECLQCHGADYSERFLAIDERYKVPLEDATSEYQKFALADAFGETKKQPVPEVSANKDYNIPEGMALVPGGEFIMGTNDWWPKSGPEHKRTLPDFFVDKYEVTNEEYLDFLKRTGRQKVPDHWRKNGGKIPKGKAKHPVSFVNWFESKDYCEWKGKRLPTEPEWEKTARGTDGRTFPWGNEFDKNKGNTPQYGHGDTMPVGSFEDGKSPYGVHDLAGNLFEWTSSWYKAYPGNKHSDPNEGELYRVVRGGSWYDCTYYKCGISAPAYNRIFFNPFIKNNTFGFRCVKNP